MKADEPLVELETDKVTVEVPAPASGMLAEIVAAGRRDRRGRRPARRHRRKALPAPPAAARARPPLLRPPLRPQLPPPAPAEAPLSPPVRKIVAENKLEPATVPGTGKDGRLTKGDVLAASGKAALRLPAPAASPQPRARRRRRAAREERVKMTRLRQTIAAA